MRLYNDDCLKILKSMQDNSVNCIVTSPPYNLGGDFHTFVNGKRVTYGDYNSYHDKVDERVYQQNQIDVLNECFRVLKNDGIMFYVHKNRIVKGMIISPCNWICKSKFIIGQIVVLDFGSTPNVDKRRFFPTYELCYVLKKHQNTKINNYKCYTDVWKMKKVKRSISKHPATFHIELPIRCIESSTKENDIILDLYMGTGTTGVACKQLNRKFIGIEIDKTYFKLAQERLFQAESEDKE